MVAATRLKSSPVKSRISASGKINPPTCCVPSGPAASQTTPQPKADVEMCRVHYITSSCPYFYTWNGSRFEFCTDACWNAPLGLQLAEGVFAEPRAWEYLSIPKGHLAPKDGKYLVQMTEE